MSAERYLPLLKHGRVILLGMLLLVALLPAGGTSTTRAYQLPVPVLAYYYIWFDPGSWDRAKTDYPLLGRYSSDDRAIMQQHIRWAKQVGIGGFIVSWKNTDKLSRRLEQLAEVAEEEQFKLSIIYQGLNFERQPLPVEQIAADLDYFVEHFAARPAFDMFARPLVIWSGTWEFSRDEVLAVAPSRREQLLILASERNLPAYERLADLVDGNAYYWSSVDPGTFPGYQEKLDSFGKAVHARAGLWIAPAAPGFDARLIGGSRTVLRKNGAMLRRQMDAAVKSSPDAIGLISWNEFSENSHVEPSRTYGMRALEVLADIQDAAVPEVIDFDSSEPRDTGARSYGIPLLGAMGLFCLASLAVIARRNAHG